MSLDIDIEAQYGDFKLDVDLSIESNGVTAIFGESCSGKTSLLRNIAGLNKKQTGSIYFQQSLWQSSKEKQFLASHLRNLAYVFQEPSLFQHLSVKANIEYAYTRADKTDSIIEPDQAIAMFGLSDLVDRDTPTLSGGERQRVAIARALCSNPSLLLMDEPLSALDQNSKQQILQMLIELKARVNFPIVYVSHALDEVSRLADQLVLLSDGKVQAQGGVKEVLTQLDLPVAHYDNAESIIDAVVAEHDEQFGLSYLNSAVGQFSVLRRDMAIGSKVRLLVAARDVSITFDEQKADAKTSTSILTIFPAIIDQISVINEAQAILKLNSNGVPILARLTRKSVSLMALKVGSQVYFQAKSVALL